MITADWLTAGDDLSEVIKIRRRVFLDELGLDEEFLTPDDSALILLVRDAGTPVATGRITPFENNWLLGQIAVLPEQRGRAYGDFLIRILIRRAYELGAYEQYVNARPQAVGFYKRLGFCVTGETANVYPGWVVMKHTGDVMGNC